MKKYAWIAVSSFTLGLLLAGALFLYLPEKSPAPRDVFATAAPQPAGPNLFAAPVPQEKATLDFVTIAERIGPSVVRIEADRREQSRPSGFSDEFPFGDDFFNRFFGQ